MSGPFTPFKYNRHSVAAAIRDDVKQLAQLIPHIQTLEQWQGILARVDPELRAHVQGLIEPHLPFVVPGAEPATEAPLETVLGATDVLEQMASS
jgi:hypothetical protein